MKILEVIQQSSSLWSFARNVKVYYNLNRKFKSNMWFLDGFGREDGSVKGAGALVMRRMTHEADERQKTILLYPVNNKVRDYFKHFGFVSYTIPKGWTDPEGYFFSPGNYRFMIRYPV